MILSPTDDNMLKLKSWCTNQSLSHVINACYYQARMISINHHEQLIGHGVYVFSAGALKRSSMVWFLHGGK